MTSRLLLAATAITMVLTTTACGEEAVVKSFTDDYGRVCTYILIEEWDGDKDANNLSCEYPRTPLPVTPTAKLPPVPTDPLPLPTAPN